MHAEQLGLMHGAGRADGHRQRIKLGRCGVRRVCSLPRGQHYRALSKAEQSDRIPCICCTLNSSSC